jgi:uncharacterized protein (TIGR02452 family)
MNIPGSSTRISIANQNKDIVIKKKLYLNINKPLKFNIYKNIRINPQYNISKIIFFKGTTNQAILHLHNINPNNNIAILNFANSHTVGGGYMTGAMAQEEELTRTIIDLFPSLALRATRNKKYYNFKWNKHVFYSSNLSLYRYDNTQSHGKYNFISSHPIKVSVITAAAPDLNRDTSNIKLFKNNAKYFYDIMAKLIHCICLVPLSPHVLQLTHNKVNILILGAFGCGAFSPPQYIQNALNIKYNKIIATLFAQTITLLKKVLYYDYIYFAIPPGDNYDTFFNVFKSFGLI